MRYRWWNDPLIIAIIGVFYFLFVMLPLVLGDVR